MHIRNIRRPYLVGAIVVGTMTATWLCVFTFFPNFTVRFGGVTIRVAQIHIDTHTSEPSASNHARPAPVSVSNNNPAPSISGMLVFADPLNGKDRIVTNEYSYWNHDASCPYSSDTWEMTSGTLLVKDGAGYSGPPTVESTALCQSQTRTNSAVFRLVTKRHDFSNITASMDFKMLGHGGYGAPINSYDGVHMWAGYQNQDALYAATVSRWDSTIVIKKKVPQAVAKCSDPANDGCYYNISAVVTRKDLAQGGSWHHADLQVTHNVAGVVTLVLSIDGQKVVTATDAAVHGPAYPEGGVGVRGDNTEFYIKNFNVTQA